MIKFHCSLNFAYLVFVIAVTGQWVIEDCETPNKEKGTCTSFYSCQPMVDVSENLPENIPQEVSQFLKAFICGYNGKTPNVCCPSNPITLPITFDRRTGTDEPPNVDKHKNLDQLPTKECGVMKTNSQIVFGNKTGVLEFPWMAMLLYKRENDIVLGCGGTIINNRYILTAAHCINDKLVQVRVGVHDVRTEENCEEETCASSQRLVIEKVIPHEEYQKKAFKNDVALLRIPPIEYSNSIKPVCLPLGKARIANFTNRNGIVTGWGTTESGTVSPELLKAELPIVPLDECQEKYKTVAQLKPYKDMATLSPRQFCAGGNVLSDSCTGDSGGPLHVSMFLHDNIRYVQQGIVSFGPKECGRHSQYPGVYTKVAYYMQWILDKIEP